MADLATLQAQRKQLISQIQAKGGQAKAPGLVKQLQALEAQIRTAKGTTGNTPITPGTGTIGGLGQAGIDAATNNLAGSDLGTTFNPQVMGRSSSEDIAAERKRVEDALFSNLTQNTAADKAREMEAKSQELQNRGIPVGSQLYNDQMNQLNSRYDTITANARNSASVLGGQELVNSTNAQEQIIGNQYNQAAGIRNQQLGEIDSLAGLQGTAQDFAMKKRELELRKQALAKQQQGGGGAAPAEEDPFHNTGLPGQQ